MEKVNPKDDLNVETKIIPITPPIRYDVKSITLCATTSDLKRVVHRVYEENSTNRLYVCDVADMVCVAELKVQDQDCAKEAEFTALAFSPDNKYVVGGCENGMIYVWDVGSLGKNQKK